MKILLDKPWSYTFFEKDGKLYLSVWCGGIGPFEIIIALNQQEIEGYNKQGAKFIEELVERIQSKNSDFLHRNIK